MIACVIPRCGRSNLDKKGRPVIGAAVLALRIDTPTPGVETRSRFGYRDEFIVPILHGIAEVFAEKGLAAAKLDDICADSRAYRISHLARWSASALRSDGIIGRHRWLRHEACDEVGRVEGAHPLAFPAWPSLRPAGRGRTSRRGVGAGRAPGQRRLNRAVRGGRAGRVLPRRTRQSRCDLPHNGTDNSQTLRWRETDSKPQSLSKSPVYPRAGGTAE
jgi:hypothetical protein